MHSLIKYCAGVEVMVVKVCCQVVPRNLTQMDTGI